MTERDPAYAGPHDEAEISVLGAAMLEPEAADLMRQRLVREDLEHTAHRSIYTAIDRLRARGFEADPLAVATELEAVGLLEASGGREYLARIVDTVPTAANMEYFVQNVADRATQRRLKETAQRIEKGVRSNGKPSAELHAWAVQEWARCAPTSTEGPPIRTLAEILADPEALNPPPIVVPRMVARERVTLVAGREKDGKTTLVTAAAAAVSAGDDFLGEPCPEGTVLIVALDEHLHDTAQKLVRFKAHPGRILIADDLGTERIGGLGNLVRSCAPDLVIVDSLSKLTSGLISDGGQAVQWAPHMTAIVAIARQTGAGIVLVHHATKSGSGYRDSTEIGAAVDMIVEMHPGSDDRSREIRAKGRWPLSSYNVRLNGDLNDPTAPLWYTLDSGELPLELRVYLYVQSHPRCAFNELDTNVTGNRTAKRDALDGLLRRGAILNQGDGSRMELMATVAKGPESLGTAAGTAWSEKNGLAGNQHGI